MAYTFAQTKAGYAKLWDSAKLTHPAQAKAIAQKLLIPENRAKLQAVQNATGVPWFMVGVMLFRESDLNFNTYLGNGQPLNRRTTVVPIGRGPFNSFLEGAVDAIKLEGIDGITDWTIEKILYWIERFNGQGYFSHGNSPYVWSWTNLYTAGKFVADHVYDPNFVDPQGGCAAVLMALFEIDPSLTPPRIAAEPQEKPKMADAIPATTPTTTVPTLPHGIDLHQIAASLGTVIGFLPMAANFFPPLKPVVPFIPLIKGVLDMAAELQDKAHDPQAIVDVIVKHLGDIKTQVQALHTQVQSQVQGGSTTTGG
jgi:lysozyme family protein